MALSPALPPLQWLSAGGGIGYALLAAALGGLLVGRTPSSWQSYVFFSEYLPFCGGFCCRLLLFVDFFAFPVWVFASFYYLYHVFSLESVPMGAVVREGFALFMQQGHGVRMAGYRDMRFG